MLPRASVSGLFHISMTHPGRGPGVDHLQSCKPPDRNLINTLCGIIKARNYREKIYDVAASWVICTFLQGGVNHGFNKRIIGDLAKEASQTSYLIITSQQLIGQRGMLVKNVDALLANSKSLTGSSVPGAVCPWSWQLISPLTPQFCRSRQEPS